MESFFTKDKEFYKSFMTLGLALMIEQAVILSVNLADNVMIGGYSEVSLAGVAAVNQIQFVLQQLIYGVSSGMVVLCSQYWGQKRIEPIKKIISIAARIAMGIALLFFVLACLMPERLMMLFTNDQAVINEGVKYLTIVKFTYLIFAATNVLLGSMRSAEIVKIAVIVSSISLVINCSINYVLIFGHFGAPELGVVGAAIGTLIARIIEFFIVFIYVFYKEKKLHLELTDFKTTDKQMVKDYITVCVPVLCTSLLWGLNNAFQNAILGHMASNVLAAYSISVVLFQLLKVASVGAATATAIIIGKAVGSGDFVKIKEYTRTAQGLFICLGLVLGAILFSIRLPLLSFYNLSDETYQLAYAFLTIQSVVVCTMSYQMPVNAGIIRGGGDTKFFMKLDIISIWCIVLPVSVLAAFVWHWSSIAVVICLNADQIFKCVPAAIRANNYKWIKKLTREDA